MTSDVINGDKLPWIKVEDASSKIQDDEEKFPTSEPIDDPLIVGL